MPVPGDRANFNYRRSRRCNPYQDDHDQHDYDGHDRVHHRAQRAMVGIAVECMNVRYLDKEKKRQQDQAHYCRYPESA
jgi:hypothetical protein